MANKRNSKGDRPEDEKALSRREFFKQGAAAGIGVTVLAGTGATLAQETPDQGIEWNYEADVVVLGSGCVGLHSAIRARDLGATVIVLEQNFDVGGRFLHSGGWTSLGGGDALQARDAAGADPEDWGLTAALVPPEDLEDDPDRLFTDVTDWSVVDSAAVAPYRLNDRELHRAWADNAAAVRQFMFDNYVRFARINGTHHGGGMTRARSARAIMKMADVTDIKAGLLSAEDRGDPDAERHTPFNPMRDTPGIPADGLGAPGCVYGGFTLARPMEFSAREKGVQFIVNRHVDEIIREQQFSGRVLGVKASYTPRFDLETGERLESFWQNGNVDERAETIYVRARRAVIIGTGGHHESRLFRSMFDPRLSDPSVAGGGNTLMGPLAADASGIIAGMKIGAALAGLQQNYQYGLGEARLQSTLGTRAKWDHLFPGHPTFQFLRAYGIDIGAGGWEHLIAVNQVGKRFYNETAIGIPTPDATYPPGTAGTNTPFVPLDWRNSSSEHIKATYDRAAAADAALAINEGSRPPHFWSGPIWAIFDAAAVQRGEWKLRFPYIADPPDEYFYKADTLAELARLVMGNPHQKMPLKYLEETVAKYNTFVDEGTDEDFEKPVMHKIDTPPFYAAIIPLAIHESYGGLRINGKAQVVDLQGEVIPGLYAGGEASGGGRQHGIGRASVHGFIAATHAVLEPVT